MYRTPPEVGPDSARATFPLQYTDNTVALRVTVFYFNNHCNKNKITCPALRLASALRGPRLFEGLAILRGAIGRPILVDAPSTPHRLLVRRQARVSRLALALRHCGRGGLCGRGGFCWERWHSRRGGRLLCWRGGRLYRYLGHDVVGVPEISSLCLASRSPLLRKPELSQSWGACTARGAFRCAERRPAATSEAAARPAGLDALLLAALLSPCVDGNRAWRCVLLVSL